jgi:hypothetical protein
MMDKSSVCILETLYEEARCAFLILLIASLVLGTQT